ncbi:MAG: hypothetical protein M3131_08060 [Actinomycetota bacterium]|nr:hypothetical protein [Actinomycetota bacterium]
MNEITIRTARGEDAPAIARLAALDEAPVPHGTALLGFVDGELAAARSLERSETVADPFRRTAELVDLLDLWAQRGRAA